MTVSERSVGSVTIIDVSGNVTLTDGAEQVRDKVRSILQQGQKSVLVNLAKVSYMDSAGLGELVQAYSTVAKQGGKLKLVSPTKRLKDLLVITKLATVFEMFDDEAAGLASFEDDRSPVADAVREEFTAHLHPTKENHDGGDRETAHNDIHLGALQAARQAVLDMRTNDEIGDDAFHQVEEELDWLEMAGGGKDEPETE